MNESIALTESTYYILLSLYKPLHGYGIMQQTEELSGGRDYGFRISAGSLKPVERIFCWNLQPIASVGFPASCHSVSVYFLIQFTYFWITFQTFSRS